MAQTKNAAVATTALLTQDVNVGGSEFLTVHAIAGPTATAAGDISLTVQAYSDDPTPAVLPISLPATDTAAAVLVGSKAYVFSRFRVAGLHKVQIQAKNNNLGTLPVEIDFDLG